MKTKSSSRTAKKKSSTSARAKKPAKKASAAKPKAAKPAKATKSSAPRAAASGSIADKYRQSGAPWWKAFL
jgi:hypothetical protein